MRYALIFPGFVVWLLMLFSGINPLLAAIIVGILVWHFGKRAEARLEAQQGAPSRTEVAQDNVPAKAPSSTPTAFQAFQQALVALISEDCKPHEVDGIMKHLNKHHLRWGCLLRDVQIWRESITFALESKNRETAESRMAVAEEMYQEAFKEYADLIAPETAKVFSGAMDFARLAFHTDSYINHARALRTKASGMKTAKAREKYFQQARDVIEEGMDNPLSDKEQLMRFLRNLPPSNENPRQSGVS